MNEENSISDNQNLGEDVNVEDSTPSGINEGLPEQDNTDNVEPTTSKDNNSETDEFATEYLGKPDTDYDYKDITPEDMTLDKDLTEKFNQLASKYNMSQKGANEFMSMAIESAKNIQQQLIQQQANEYKTRMDSWEQKILTDPEVGGVNFDESKRIAENAYKEFIQKDPECHQFFQQTGLNGNPTVFKMLYEFGKQMQDSKIYNDGDVAAKERTAAEILFGADA